MKTSQANQAPKKITVNFVSANHLLIEKVIGYFKNSRTIEVRCGETPLPENSTDCYILPFKDLTMLFNKRERPDTWLPVIAYGSQLFLREAFSSGCADYLKEPWDPAELEVRLHKMFERSRGVVAGQGQEKFVLTGNRLKTDAGEIALAINEARILRVLLNSQGEVVSREVLFYAIWGKAHQTKSRVVDVYVSSIRKKLKSVTAFKIVQVRREGYLLS